MVTPDRSGASAAACSSKPRRSTIRAVKPSVTVSAKLSRVLSNPHGGGGEGNAGVNTVQPFCNAGGQALHRVHDGAGGILQALRNAQAQEQAHLIPEQGGGGGDAQGALRLGQQEKNFPRRGKRGLLPFGALCYTEYI